MFVPGATPCRGRSTARTEVILPGVGSIRHCSTSRPYGETRSSTRASCSCAAALPRCSGSSSHLSPETSP